MKSFRGAFGVLALVATSLLVLGCTVADQPASTESLTGETPSPSPSPSSSPTSSGAALQFPASCDDVASAEQLSVIVAQDMRLVSPDELSMPPGWEPGDDLPGPVAQSTAANAEQLLDCVWRPRQASSLFVSAIVAKLEPAVRDELLESLRGSSDFDESQLDGVPIFALSWGNEVQGLTTTYAIDGDTWIALNGPLNPEPSAEVIAIALSNLHG